MKVKAWVLKMHRQRVRSIQITCAMVVTLWLAISAWTPQVQAVQPSILPVLQTLTAQENLLVNGGFEEGVYSPTSAPSGWSRGAWTSNAVFTWDDTQAHSGSRSVKITNLTPNDALWQQSVTVKPDTIYVLSGWVRTDNVLHTESLVDAGASLCLNGTWTHTPGIFGTNDWSLVSLIFNSRSSTQVNVAARLGYWAGLSSGTVWFDDLDLRELQADGPHPRWKILVLIYAQTDFTYTDSSGLAHRLLSSMSEYEKTQAASAASQFVTTDIPALSSGNMEPLLTIRYPAHALTSLDPFGSGWWPSPSNTAADRDPTFDAVIVIWDPRCTDQATGSYVWIGGGAAGLTPPMGTGQTYATLIIEAAVYYGHRNVFKHEWGHSLLDYYEAAGTAPSPAVTNHANVGQYVHWPTGESYVWLDETDLNPIPNSIYHNESGFTHDYYSGTTATADQPARRLGITPLAWATGGPVSKPTLNLLPTPTQQIQSVRDRVSELVIRETLSSGRGGALQAKLGAALRALDNNEKRAAANILGAFLNQVNAFVKTGRLETMDAQFLTGTVNQVINRILEN